MPQSVCNYRHRCLPTLAKCTQQQTEKSANLSCRGVQHQHLVTAAELQVLRVRQPQPKSMPYRGYSPSVRPLLLAVKSSQTLQASLLLLLTMSAWQHPCSSWDMVWLERSASVCRPTGVNDQSKPLDQRLSSVLPELLHFLHNSITTSIWIMSSQLIIMRILLPLLLLLLLLLLLMIITLTIMGEGKREG